MKRIVLIGAGSAQFGFGTLGEIFTSEVLRDAEVVLLDINPKALELVYQTGQAFIEEHSLPTRLSATTDRKKALKGADYVIISIEVGDRFSLWDQDRCIPQHYGIQQVYGENGGPGGLFHSLRIIPPILEICADVREICPHAHVVNYSNPMSRICTTVHRAYPDLNFVGLCHEVSSLERYLPTILNVPFEDLELTAGGLNHFSCLLKAHYKDGKDAYPDIRRLAPDFFEKVPGASDHLKVYRESGTLIETEGVTEDKSLQTESYRRWVERGLFKYVLETYDLLPITTDSHFGEYTAWAYDIVDQRGILDFYHYYRICMSQVQPKIEFGIKERVVPIMEALDTGDIMLEAAVNIPNEGFIKGLPASLVVEVSAHIGAKGVKGVALESMPPSFLALLQNQVGVHMLCAEAVLTKSKKAVVQALLADPVVTRASCLKELVDVMVAEQSAFLGYLT